MGEIASTLHRHQVIGIDTSIFIYHVEASSSYVSITTEILQLLASGSFLGVTSVITLMEITVQPLRLDRPEVADTYGVLLSHFPNLAIAAIDGLAARRAAELRATYNLRPADALQIAACLQSGATAFLTNDQALQRVTDLEILVLDDYLVG